MFDPGSARTPEEGNGNPLQHSCLKKFMIKGAWWATVYRVTKNQTCLHRFPHQCSTQQSRNGGPEWRDHRSSSIQDVFGRPTATRTVAFE